MLNACERALWRIPQESIPARNTKVGTAAAVGYHRTYGCMHARSDLTSALPSVLFHGFQNLTDNSSAGRTRAVGPTMGPVG
jgi:hypothetical protein